MAILKLYGEPGWGSAIVECQLVWCDIPFEFRRVGDLFKDAKARAALEKINPLAQVPTLVLPGGEVMTESAAITLWLADLTGEADLVPEAGAPERARFLRWLVFLVANIYPTYTYADDPARFVPEAGARAGFFDSVEAWRKKLYGILEAEVRAPWFLGERFSAIDLYIGVLSRWEPRRAWHEANAPKFLTIARAAHDLPRLADVWARNFPMG